MAATDVLIIGSGIAGLTIASKLGESNPETQITIVTKSDANESNTKYAQGGVAAVLDEKEDSFDQHIQDTLKAGDWLCNREVVELVVKEGPLRLKELISWGAEFDFDEPGKYDLGREGGHTANRILHHKDITGFEIERALLAKIQSLTNVQVLPEHYAIDLITQHHLPKSTDGSDESSQDLSCFGAYILNKESGNIMKLVSKTTVLASGGTGQVYQNTSNPVIATGDGIGMAYRARAEIKDMEFIQFHPTTLFEAGKSPSFLISEALRGEGAKLRTKAGKAFMHKYDEREELASRDIVAKAIDTEIKILGDEHVYLDCRHMDYSEFLKHFPNINDYCLSIGIDIRKDMIPVVPAAHYLCGGVKTDLDGATNLKNLYACGECACTGLHGANRLASNSLLEALVFAHRIVKSVQENLPLIKLNESIPEWDSEGTSEPLELVLISQDIHEIQSLMSNFMGIVRSNERLQRASKRISMHYEETTQLYNRSTISPQLCELRNLVTVAYLIIEQSIARTENRGVFFNIDLSRDSIK